MCWSEYVPGAPFAPARIEAPEPGADAAPVDPGVVAQGEKAVASAIRGIHELAERGNYDVQD